MARSRFLVLVALSSLSALIAGCMPMPVRPAEGRFVERTVQVGGRDYRYQVFVPTTRDDAKPPAILFLHGSGERGDDNRKQVDVGLGPYVRAHATDFPAIVVFPQAPEGSEWTGDEAGTVDAGAIAFAALDAAQAEFGADRDRVYLTGMSMGGFGTWELALQQPRRFAALAPVCGGITVDWQDERPGLRAKSVASAPDPFAAAAARLKRIPIWIFHGGKDDVVPPAQSRRMAAALEAAGARDARYTEFPDANHNSWDPAYTTPELWAWLFAQRL